MESARQPKRSRANTITAPQTARLNQETKNPQKKRRVNKPNNTYSTATAKQRTKNDRKKQQRVSRRQTLTPSLFQILNPRNLVDTAMTAAQRVGETLIKPFYNPRIAVLEQQIQEMQAQVKTLSSQLKSQQHHSKAPTVASSSSTATTIPPAPVVSTSGIIPAAPAIPMAPPVLAGTFVPPPPPVSHISLTKKPLQQQQSQPQAGNKMIGFSLADLQQVRLKKVDGEGEKRKQESGETGGLSYGVSRDALAAVKLRSASSTARSSSSNILKDKNMNVKTGLDFSEIAKIQLKKAPVNRSPGGTPHKPKARPGAFAVPESPAEALMKALHKRVQAHHLDKENEISECDESFASDDDFVPAKNFDFTPITPNHIPAHRHTMFQLPNH